MARDAAEITPKFVPDDSLRTRDNSGGIDMESLNHSVGWDEGGRVIGPKAYLSAGGGGGKGKKRDRDYD